MKRMHKKMGKLIFILLLVLVTFNVANVNAAKDEIDDEIKTTCDTDYNTDAQRNECKKKAKICAEKLANNFDIKREISSDKKKAYITIDKKHNEDKDDNDKQFVFDVKVTRNGTDSEIIKGKKTGEKFAIDTNYDGSDSVIIEVSATISDDGKEADVSCEKIFNVYSRIRLESTKVDSVTNDALKAGTGICWKYKNDKLTSDDVKSNSKYKNLLSGGNLSYSKIKAINGGESKFNSLFPYCNSNEVTNVYTDNQILSQMYQAASIVVNLANSSSTPLPNHDNDDYIKIDPSKKLSLTCDAFSDNLTKNVRKFFFLKQAESKSVTFHYTPSKSETKEVCSVQCMEEVTVTYGPPVSVKAGLCFEYEVEIRSKVTCNSVIKQEMPDINQYKVCEPSVNCHNGSSSFVTQAGPNEEFDSCVNKCDGGKYSQSCINSCYNKVYKKGSKTKKQSLSLSDDAVVKFTSSSGFAGNESWCNQYRAYQNNNAAADVYYAYKTQGYYGGYYTRQNGLTWESYNKYSGTPKINGEKIKTIKNCYWNDYARFYFNNLNLAIRTVANGQAYGNAWNYMINDNLNKWSYVPDRNNGVKLGYNHYIGAYCDDVCELVNTCDGYLNDIAPDGQESRYKAYLKDLEEYNNAIEGCSAKAKCSETTATYTMTANNSINIKTCTVDEGKGNDGSNGSCTTWEETSDKKTSITTDSKNNIITKEVSGVCASTPTTDHDDYKTVISFPGSYINNKTGDVVFKVPTGKEKYYSYKKNQYCVPLNAKDVNKNWYIWDQVNKRAEREKSSVNTTLTTDTTGTEYNKYTHSDAIYNIGATIKKFGFLDWNVDVSCFYAVSTVSDTPSGGDKCTGTDCEKTSATNYDTKAAALDELFPAADTTDNAVGTSTTTELKESAKVTKLNYTTKKSSATKVANSSTSRNVGYNWSCDSTNLTNKNYPVTPTALISKIQKQGDSVYSDSTERDFHLTITKQNIKNIRSYNKDKAYTDFGTDSYANKVNNISFYKSSFLKNTSYVYSYSGPRVHLCNNMKNGECDVLSEYVSSEQTCVKLNNEKVGVALYE